MGQELQKDKELSSHLPSLLLLWEMTLCPIVFMWLVTNHFRHAFVGGHIAACCMGVHCVLVLWIQFPIIWEVWSKTHTQFFKVLVC